MKVVVYLIIAAMMFPIACANTKSKSRRHSKKSRATPAMPLQKAHSSDVISGNATGTLVSANWMQRYKALEAKHGKIAEDATIYMEGDKYRISTKVADHFSSMVRESN